MFKVDLFCDDAKLGAVLQALVGKTIGKPEYYPVANAHAVNGKVKALTNGSLLAEFSMQFQKKNLTRVTIADVRQWMPTVGRGEHNTYALVTKTLEAKILKKKGSGKQTYYEVLPQQGRSK